MPQESPPPRAELSPSLLRLIGPALALIERDDLTHSLDVVHGEGVEVAEVVPHLDAQLLRPLLREERGERGRRQEWQQRNGQRPRHEQQHDHYRTGQQNSHDRRGYHVGVEELYGLDVTAHDPGQVSGTPPHQIRRGERLQLLIQRDTHLRQQPESEVVRGPVLAPARQRRNHHEEGQYRDQHTGVAALEYLRHEERTGRPESDPRAVVGYTEHEAKQHFPAPLAHQAQQPKPYCRGRQRRHFGPAVDVLLRHHVRLRRYYYPVFRWQRRDYQVVAGLGLLVRHKLCVRPTGRGQLGVTTCLDETAVVQDQNPVRADDTGEPMGYDESRAALH